MAYNWDEASFQKVKALHERGLSSAKIAVIMGEGLSRNSIISIMHRRGLRSTKPKPIPKPKPAPRPPRAKVAAKTKGARTGMSRAQMAARKGLTVPGAVDFEPIEADTSPLARDIFIKPLPGSVPVPLIELQHGLCKWSVSGDSRPFLFCALPVAPPRLVGGYSIDRVYCPEHARHGVQQPK